MKPRFPVALLLFLYVWLMVGFATGTATLLGPVKWITEAVRASQYHQQENRVMLGVILAYGAASFFLSRWLVARMRRTRAVTVKCAIPAVSTLAAGVSLFGWMNPAGYAAAAGGPGGEVSVRGGAQFVFGPYPDRARLEQLKSEGITAVISLQHPAVLPFEPAAIEAEKEAAAELGLRFVHAPMLPWVSSNEDSLATIRKLASEGGGRYYVHCGLGRDRTGVVMRMLEGLGAEVARGEGVMAARTFAVRLAERGNQMERGTFQELEKDLWLIPYPNHHEMYGNMLAGQVAHVLLLLNPEDNEQKGWIEEATAAFTASRVPFTLKTVWPHDVPYTRQLVKLARSLPRPTVVVVPFTPPRERPQVVQAFLAGYGEAVGRKVALAAPYTKEKGPAAHPAQAASAPAARP